MQRCQTNLNCASRHLQINYLPSSNHCWIWAGCRLIFFWKKFHTAFRKFDYLCRAICITTNYEQNNNWRCTIPGLSDSEHTGPAMRQVVTFGHIYPGQSRRRTDPFQGTAAWDSGHITKDADRNLADTGRRRIRNPYRIPRSSTAGWICVDTMHTHPASPYRCADRLGQRKHGNDYKQPEKCRQGVIQPVQMIFHTIIRTAIGKPSWKLVNGIAINP